MLTESLKLLFFAFKNFLGVRKKSHRHE